MSGARAPRQARSRYVIIASATTSETTRKRTRVGRSEVEVEAGELGAGAGGDTGRKRRGDAATARVQGRRGRETPPYSGSVGEEGGVEAGDEAEGVFVVNFFQDFVGEAHAIHGPERVVFFVIREVFVLGFEDAEVGLVFVGNPAVFAEEDAVLIFFEEGAGGARLASEFGDDGAGFDEHVGGFVEPAGEVGEVVGLPGEVGGDEVRARVFFEEIALFAHDDVPGSWIRGGAAAIGAEDEFEPALVVFVDGIPEGFGRAGVDEDGDAEAGAGFPDRIHARVVDGDAGAGVIFDVEAEAFEKFEAASAGGDVGFELTNGAIDPAVGAEAVEIDVGEKDQAAWRVRGVEAFGGFCELRAGAAGEVDHDGHVKRVHLARERFEVLREHVPLVIVDVDEREFGAGEFVFGDDEGGGGVVGFEVHRRPVGGGGGEGGEGDEGDDEEEGMAHEEEGRRAGAGCAV